MPAYSRSSKRPLGQITRGKTAPNRLRRVDNFICQYDPGLLRLRALENCFYVDLGYGAEPFTTLESAARLRRFNPHLPVLGIEIDPERVSRALPFADEQTLFRLGGFNVPLQPGETVRLIRAMNVLRQYEEAEFLSAVAQMGHSLIPGGLLLEGQSAINAQPFMLLVPALCVALVVLAFTFLGDGLRDAFDPRMRGTS